MNIATYDELIRIGLTGLLFATSVFPGYFLVSIPMNKQIKQLEQSLGIRHISIDKSPDS